MKSRFAWLSGLILTTCMLTMTSAGAAQDTGQTIAIKSGRFDPAEISIPAGKKVKLLVSNETALPAEIESYDFTMEKVIPGHSKVPVYVGPLKAGKYGFFNDFAQSAKGTLIVE